MNSPIAIYVHANHELGAYEPTPARCVLPAPLTLLSAKRAVASCLQLSGVDNPMIAALLYVFNPAQSTTLVKPVLNVAQLVDGAHVVLAYHEPLRIRLHGRPVVVDMPPLPTLASVCRSLVSEFKSKLAPKPKAKPNLPALEPGSSSTEDEADDEDEDEEDEEEYKKSKSKSKGAEEVAAQLYFKKGRQAGGKRRLSGRCRSIRAIVNQIRRFRDEAEAAGRPLVNLNATYVLHSRLERADTLDPSFSRRMDDAKSGIKAADDEAKRIILDKGPREARRSIQLGKSVRRVKRMLHHPGSKRKPEAPPPEVLEPPAKKQALPPPPPAPAPAPQAPGRETTFSDLSDFPVLPPLPPLPPPPVLRVRVVDP
jgi:hypothetical protein